MIDEQESMTSVEPDGEGLDLAPGELCPECHGEGKVREWSTVLAIIGLAGFGSGFYVLYHHFFVQALQRGLGMTLIILFGLGIFGILPLIDRGDCKRCSGMGRLEDDD